MNTKYAYSEALKDKIQSAIKEWIEIHNIKSHYSQEEDIKCLGVAESFNRTIKLIEEKYLANVHSNRWIDSLH